MTGPEGDAGTGPGRLTPAHLALLDRITDPMPELLADALRTVRDLGKQIDRLVKAEDKKGDCLVSLEFDAYLAVEAVERLGELIEERQR